MKKIALAALIGVVVLVVAVLASYLVYRPGGIDRAAYPLLAGEETEQAAAAEVTQPDVQPEQPAEEAVAQPEQPEAPTETAAVEPGAAQPEAAASGLGALLASADPDAGRKLAKKCSACHTVDKGGKKKIGPSLWDVVGRAIGSAEGFKFSRALADMGGAWGYEELDGFITKPKAFAKGTKMSFSGIKSETDRADLIAYLRSLSDNPKPLP